MARAGGPGARWGSACTPPAEWPWGGGRPAGEAQHRARAAEGPGRRAPSLGAFVHSCWAGRLAEVGGGVARVTQPFWNWACMSSVLPHGMVMARLSRGPVFCAEAPAVVGSWVWAAVPAILNPPFPPTRPGPRSQPPQHTGSCCPCRRVLMGPEGLSADGLSCLLQQGQLSTPRGVLDPAVSRT